ncbi:MAG: aminomethyl-transferring glycine dehydrogenase subunit GcvPB, partial [Alphaproteobacteria bacterium]
VAVMRALASDAIEGRKERFEAAPQFAPRRRLDETAAARKPVLRWYPDEQADVAKLEPAE